jgi:16S rRNA (uracil1498-N3)-methyltransferase
MQRFFVPPDSLTGNPVRISGDPAHQIARVLRMQPGDHVILLDGLGQEYLVQLAAFGKDEVTAQVVEKRPGQGEPAHKVTLYISLLNKPDKFEWALQKCTELGAASFVPVRGARSISDAPGSAKMERWRRIIKEAAEQSGRSILPTLHDALELQEAFKRDQTKVKSAPLGEHVAIMPSLDADRSLRAQLSDIKRVDGSISIFTGPEGGFTEDEVHAAHDAGIILITLGPRTLRAETAPLAALTIVLYELGEMET